MTTKLNVNERNIEILAQKVTDYIAGRIEPAADMKQRMGTVEEDLKVLVAERGSKFSATMKWLVPIFISLAITAGGWVWTASNLNAKIADLEAGRNENKGNIATLSKMVQDVLLQSAVQGVRYEATMEKLRVIQNQLDVMERRKQ